MFTEQAKPFLIGNQEKDKDNPDEVKQKVSLFTIDFKELTGVKFNKDENKAIVMFEEEYKNISPFANLYAKRREYIKEGDILTHKAYFSKYEDGWKLETNPGIEFLNF